MRALMNRLAVLVAALMMVGGVALSVGATSASAATTHGNNALNWAINNAEGHWYEYGGSGLAYYDCSGLVMTSFAHAGVNLPRTVADIIHSSHVTRTYHPVRGDIAVWGSGWSAYHVAFVTNWSGHLFQAEKSGTRVYWYSDSGWPPTAYYHVQ